MFRAALECFEPPGQSARQPRRFHRLGAEDELVEPRPAFVVGGHAIRAFEDRLLDAAVRRHLDRVPD